MSEPEDSEEKDTFGKEKKIKYERIRFVFVEKEKKNRKRKKCNTKREQCKRREKKFKQNEIYLRYSKQQREENSFVTYNQREKKKGLQIKRENKI